MTINETFVILDDTIQPCPRRQDSSWYSQGTYSYITELLNRGYKRELSILDYPAVESNDEAQLLAGKILDDWNVELKKENPKLLHTLVTVRIFGLHFGLAGISYFLEGIAQLMEGYFLSRLLLWFQTPNAPVDEVYWYGGFLSLALFIHGILHHVQFFETMRVGMRLRVGLTAAIYQKCLELSISNTQSTGLIVNLVSNDVQRFEDAAPFAHFFWAGPVQLLTLSYFIYREVGWSFLAGTIGVLLLIPIQGYFATAFKRLRQITVAYRDDRIKNISDMFAGIMVVKLYAWEIPFKEKINQLRNLELKFIWRGNILKSVNESIFFASSAIINTLIFSSFHFSGGKLSPAIVFSVITYIQYIKLSMTNFFPKSIQFLSECQVSLTRIQEFLSLESISTGAQENDTLDQAFGDEDYVLVGENASFAWESSKLGAKEGTQPKTVLGSMNFKISRKSLNILCGPVGSGKTSFLHSLIGDLCLTSGKVHFGTRKISFAAQTPWILSGTIRENIVFGAEYKHDRFLKVLECCSLERDISMFEHGVDTILGERGVTLSGGQRARVALARAIYYEADVYLLDDPLSAVDTKVGRNLFENCIMKFLADKLQYLKDCKSIFLMNNGNLEQVGSCKEVFELYPEMSKSVESDSSQFEHEEISNEPELKLSKLRHQTIYRNPSERNTVLVKEESAVGNITLQTYWRFLKSGGGVSGGILLVFMLVLGQVIAVAADIWLSRWSSATDINQRDSIWFTVLVVLSLSTLLAAVLRGSLQWCVRQSCEVENLMVSTERVYEYTGLDSEANEETEASVPNGWPSQGKVEIRNMSLTYPNLQDPSKPGSLVLKKLLVTFEPGTKIGIVGRTGAGKSSFLQALFRLVEPSPQDSVYIDDISTSSLGLRTLRSSISIIPQDPFCFKGTLRFNLDPFDKYSDSQIWDALRAVELHATVDKLPDKLESAVAENGSNWSVGERQLICLARAILKNTKLIVMDEATSSVDMNTDKLIQRAIRAKGGLFSNSTVLTIAHRLNTVIDYDKILVLEAGEIVEFGTPKELIIKDVNDPTAWFARMVQQMGPEARNVLINLALKQ
ncbi:hypothetical protein HDV02_004714 [Globomyces sp. JEL0801]|nr:hypothetical protein HDV02_004714 [Globomyces sp. JEL0801]